MFALSIVESLLALRRISIAILLSTLGTVKDTNYNIPMNFHLFVRTRDVNVVLNPVLRSTTTQRHILGKRSMFVPLGIVK